MYKLIQSIVLSAVVLAPVSSLDLSADALSHHTPSHVSTLAVEVAHTRKTPHKHRKYRKSRKYRKMRVRVNKSARKISPNQRSISREQTPSDPIITIPKVIPSVPAAPTGTPLTPGNFPPTTELKPIDPIMGNPINPPSPDVILPNPASGIPTIPLTIPGGIPNPSGDTSIPNPNLPTTFPGGAIK